MKLTFRHAHSRSTVTHAGEKVELRTCTPDDMDPGEGSDPLGCFVDGVLVAIKGGADWWVVDEEPGGGTFNKALEFLTITA